MYVTLVLFVFDFPPSTLIYKLYNSQDFRKLKEYQEQKEMKNQQHFKHRRNYKRGSYKRQRLLITRMGKFNIKFLKVYVTECEKRAKEQNEQTENLLTELLGTTIKDTSSQTRISQLETLAMVVSKLDACHCDLIKLVKVKLKQINRFEFNENKTKAKKSIEKTSNKK